MILVRFNIGTVLLLLFFLGTTPALWSQDRCGTVEYSEKLAGKGLETETHFEQWIRTNLRTKASGTKETGRTKEGTYQIPVVVHIIHSGESHASNITDEQVFSQIRVLNDDYNRLNTDATNTPSEFLAVAGNAQIEFVLAKRTPEGLPTTGIVRMQGPKTSYTVSDNYDLKALSYWPAEDYLNIWVCNLTDYLGYAQFPQSNTLSGLENSSSNRLTDGVVITYTAFGSVDDGNFNLQNNYNKGRTTTHEVGHFFGLRHIWGDDQGACGGDGDYVDDTPDQADRTLNCPSHPRTSCATTTMFQNFLDYTNDACMNLFTVGQVERMAIVLENSPRRSTLHISPGLLEPQPVANDLGIRAINAPAIGECSGTVIPAIEIRNYGSNAITSATIRILKDGIPAETKDLTVSLSPLESAEVSFSSLTSSPGINTFTFEIISTNGVADGNDQNDSVTREVFVPDTAPTPIVETLETIPATWQLFNPDGLFTWESVSAINGQPDNKALKMNFYDYEDNEGEIDVFLSPVVDLSSAPAGILLFDVSYAQYQNSGDGLKVVVLSDCNTDVTQGQVIYEKYGNSLATSAKRNEAFSPQSADDWRTEILNLEQYLGQPGLQLAFVGVNDWGNNLFLDNIRIFTEDFANVTLKRITAPPPLVCAPDVVPVISVRNSGTAVSSLDILYTVNGTTNAWSVEGLDLQPGQETDIALPEIVLSSGENSLSVELVNPNGAPDVDPSDNSGGLEVVFESKESPVPFHESFEGDFENTWTILSPQGNPTWLTENFADNKALVYKGFENTIREDEAWLVSPSLDLTQTSVASLVFDMSYAIRNNNSEVLEIRASRGCDQPFEVIQTYSGNQLTEETSEQPWTPQDEPDWTRKNFVNLSDLTGEREVRLAFVVSNRNGNNLYLDNIRFYLSDDENPVDVVGPFNVYPNPLRSGENLLIAFNLAELYDITVDISDSMGKQIYRGTYNGILNQTLFIQTEDYASGLYIIRVLSGEKVYHSKFMIDR